MNLNGNLDPIMAVWGFGVHQPLPKAPKYPRAPSDPGEAEKRGWKQQRGAARAGMFGFSFATEN